LIRRGNGKVMSLVRRAKVNGKIIKNAEYEAIDE